MLFKLTQTFPFFAGTYIQKRNLSNVQIVVKGSASHGPWPFIEFYTWKIHPINVQLVEERSISEATSRLIFLPIQTSNHTTAGLAGKSLGETVI